MDFDKSALSKLQYDRLAPERLAFFSMAYLKLTYLRSSLERLAPVKLIPWKERRLVFKTLFDPRRKKTCLKLRVSNKLLQKPGCTACKMGRGLEI